MKSAAVLFFCFLAQLGFGQVTGTVVDATGEPLVYVSVYVEGTSKGTTTNTEGVFSLFLNEGEEVVVFQYVGFETQRVEIADADQDELQIVLKPTSFELKEITIAADAEDPAYAIIRNAIRMRPTYNKEVKEYAADIYVKGLIKMLKTPKKILGQEIGDLDGMVDSTGQGIVYLGESQSKIYYQEPNKLKEVMYSSKVAESDGSFNPNMLQNAYFDIYDEHFEFGRTVLNPIADNAMQYYKYKLLGVQMNDRGELVNKIQVIPKSSARPTLAGYLFVIEDTWRINQLELAFTGKAVKVPFFDTITIKQIQLPVGEDLYRVFNQTMTFSGGLFGFKMGGTFNFIFSDYDLSPNFSDDFFGSETFRMEQDAADKSKQSWDTIRPIPLTEVEVKEYDRKDSLKILWSSKEYLDSVDHKNNKFNFGSLMFGYSWQNSYRKRYFSIGSPLQTVQFNAIEGYNAGVAIRMTQYDSTQNKAFTIVSDLRYGFSDNRLKNKTTVTYRTNRIHREFFWLTAGDYYQQYNFANPVKPVVGTLSALLFKDHLMYMYRRREFSFNYSREVINGLTVRAGISHQQRLPLDLNTDLSYWNKDEMYNSNFPAEDGSLNPLFNIHKATEFKLSVGIRPFQKYMTFVGSRSRERSNWPDINIQYLKGFGAFGGDTSFDRFRLQLRDSYVNTKLLGYFQYNLVGSVFATKDQLFFPDLNHFMTNISLFAFTDTYSYGFKLMPHYEFSTAEDYVKLNFEQHFDGFLLDYVPLLKDSGFKTVMGGNMLYLADGQTYYEANVGLENVGFGIFRLLRLDYVWSFSNDGLLNHGVVIGITSGFGE